MTDAARLTSLLEGASSLRVVCHDNPDPDCLASALALRRIALNCGVDRVDLLYGGSISHQQNRAFVNLLELDLGTVESADLETYGLVAFVDHAVPGQNSSVPADVRVDVVLDHHPTAEPPDAALVDVRPEYGATSTILVEYLRAVDTDISPKLASALLFAIHRERLDYVRGPTRHEYEAALFLHPLSDVELLEQLYGSAFSPATLDAIGRAIRNREVRGSALVSTVGRTGERGALAQAADYLLNLEGADTVLVFGVTGDAVDLSARSVDPRVDLGRVLAEAFGDVGRAGGHRDMAGGRIPLGLFADRSDDDENLIGFVSERVTARFFAAMHLEDESEE